MSENTQPNPGPHHGRAPDRRRAARRPGPGSAADTGHDRPTVQLRLLQGTDPVPEWSLDERTRTVGRQGVAQAREILRRAHPPEPAGRAYSKAS